MDLKDLSLEQKVGQLLVAHFKGPLANEEARQLLEKAHVGSFIYYNWANELSSPEQVKKLSNSLQKMNQTYNPLPLLICIDQEGGRISRLTDPFPTFPSQEEIGNSKDPTLAYEIAKKIGEELYQVGINMNLAPVVDVRSKDLSNWLSDRTFSHDPKMVVAFAQEAMKGYNEIGIIPVLKHYPGHGRASSDSHRTTSIVNMPLPELEEVELYPFQILAKQAPVIMTGHLLVPAIDATYPATFSSTLLQSWLRGKIGFKGVIMSDSLVMKGLFQFVPSYEEGAIMSIQAGVDLICLGGKLLHEQTQDELTIQNVINIHRAIIEAVRCGRISEKQIDDSVARILALKKNLR